MIKRFLIVSILLALSFAPSWSQEDAHYNKLVAEGHKYFEQEQFHLAAKLYRDAVAFDIAAPGVDYRLAECYRRMFNYHESEAYYLKVLYSSPAEFPLSLFYYALMLKLNGNLSESMKRFDQFIGFHENNAGLASFVEQAIIERAGCEIARQDRGVPVAFKAEPVSGKMNSAYNDFAPAFRNPETLVIASSRILSNRALIDERNGEAFTDNYYFLRVGDTWEDKTRKEFSVTNTLYHDGTGSFTRSGDQYFFTICEERCRIFETHLKNNKWTKPSPLNDLVNDPASDTKQPAISPGGDTLYYASNRPGGYGQFDIWMSIDAGNNAWLTPVNAGHLINTRANDIAPSLTRFSNILFFSSDGHPGYGGYDLFVAKSRSSGDTVLYNLNLPFNSIKDDCFITFNDEDTYWSSNREGGKGGFDIYAARNITDISLVSKLSLKNRNDSRLATLTSRTAQSENIQLLASRNEETIDYNKLTYERKAIVNRMVENRLQNRANRPEEFSGISAEEFDMLNQISHSRFQALLLKQKYASTLLMEVGSEAYDGVAHSITGRLLDDRTGNALRFARVLLTDEYGEILKITGTNESGQFRFTDVSCDSKLFLRLENSTGRSQAASVHDLRVTGSDKNNSLYVENVYFDFDHYTIRPEAAQVLTELAAFLLANPGAQVEIYAFADDRGSSAYNFELTQKRGEAVAAFLARKGVNATSLAIIPKGKQKMLQAATEIQRQYNRRAQFYINGVKENFSASVKTYILKKEADWNLIARSTGVPKEHLQDLNGSQADIVRAFQPVRVPANAEIIPEELFFVGI